MGKDLAPFSYPLPLSYSSSPLEPLSASSTYSELENEVKSAMSMLVGLANKIETRMADLKQKEERWNDMERRVAESTSRVSNMVTLNVGGQHFTTSITTLLQYKGSFFEALLAIHFDNASELFIDRDPRYFGQVLNYLRDGRLRAKPEDLEELRYEFEFYKIPFPSAAINLNSVYTPAPTMANTQSTYAQWIHTQNQQNLQQNILHQNILQQNLLQQNLLNLQNVQNVPNMTHNNVQSVQTHQQNQYQNPFTQSATVYNHLSIPIHISAPRNDGLDSGTLLTTPLKDVLRSWFPNQHFYQLYRASRDGFKTSDFQRLCDHSGPTITIIQSAEGYLFGGYFPLQWDISSFVHKTHPKSLLFTLTNPYSLPPSRYVLRAGEGGRTQERGQPFMDGMMGWGPDLNLAGDPNVTFSFISFPDSFVDTTGKKEKTFTGMATFKTKEIEVYLLRNTM